MFRFDLACIAMHSVFSIGLKNNSSNESNLNTKQNASKNTEMIIILKLSHKERVKSYLDSIFSMCTSLETLSIRCFR